MSYNGWTNRATWNVALWIDNTEELYRQRVAASIKTAKDARRFVRRLWPDGYTPDGDYFGRANWQELADAWQEE